MIDYLKKAPERRKRKKERSKGKPSKRIKHKRVTTTENLEKNFHLAFDLGLDDLMSSKNLSDLSRQIQWAYSNNRHLDNTPQMWMCGRQQRLKEVMEYQIDGQANWDVHWFDGEFDSLPHGKKNI